MSVTSLTVDTNVWWSYMIGRPILSEPANWVPPHTIQVDDIANANQDQECFLQDGISLFHWI